MPVAHLQWLKKSGSDAKRENWKAAVIAQFGWFVRGERVDDSHDVKRIEDRRVSANRFDHQVWALGIRFEPQFRFFGMFLCTDLPLRFSSTGS